MTVAPSMEQQHSSSTRPAVSRSISELEHTLRVRLFDRHHRGIEPTTYGQALASGVGKTHLAVALGREAILPGHSVQFVAATTVVAQLAKGHAKEGATSGSRTSPS